MSKPLSKAANVTGEGSDGGSGVASNGKGEVNSGAIGEGGLGRKEKDRKILSRGKENMS